MTDVLQEMPDNSISSCITDPPYGMSQDPDIAKVMQCWIDGETYQHRSRAGFMGCAWDAFVPGPEAWRHVYRVLKPGGYCLVFASSRTWDLLSMALRFAGFQNRDTIASFSGPPALAWTHAQGFPKQLDVSKALDKIAGAEREIVGYNKQGTRSMFDSGKPRTVTLPATGVATRFDGYHSALKPAWEVILVFMKPLDGTYAENALRHSQAGFNVDRCRIASRARSFRANREDKPVRNCYGKYGVTNYDGSKGRYPSNILFQHASGCVLTGQGECRTSNSPADPTPSRKPGAVPVTTNVKSGHHYGDRNGRETVEIWECEEGCPIKALRVQSGFSRSSQTDSSNDSPGATFCLNREKAEVRGHTDSGYADRFFKVFDPPQPFILAPKTSPRERSSFNTHVAVKPQRVLQYLANLVSPPDNGIILDPFAGSGSTALACLELGVDFICVEREPEYCEIAERRLSEAVKVAG